MTRLRLAVALALVPAAVTAATPAATGQTGANVIVNAATEPPDFSKPGGKFRFVFTVANEGSGRAGESTAEIFLSKGRQFSDDDVARRIGRYTIGALRPGRQTTRRVTLRLPAALAEDKYFIVICTRFGSGSRRCRFSGQSVFVAAVPPPVGRAGSKGDTGAKGAKGGTGPTGLKGAPGDSRLRLIPQTTLDTGFADIFDVADTTPTPDADETEGSTQTRDLITVGPLTFRAICREKVQSDFRGEASDEAKILVEHSDPGATMILRGPHGPRANIPAGRGQAGVEGALGGEGQHMALATLRPRDEGFSTRPDDIDPNTAGNQPNPDGTNQNDDRVSGFNAGSVFVALSSGVEVVFNGYAGIDVLGEGTPDNEPGQQRDENDSDKDPGPDGPDADTDPDVEDDACVFGGSVTVLRGG